MSETTLPVPLNSNDLLRLLDGYAEPACPHRPTRFLRRIDEQPGHYRDAGPIVIIAFGDSVTMGATANGVFEPDAVYHQRLKRMLEARFPKAVFSVVNAGIGGDTTGKGLDRIERDVLRHGPDLVLVAFGLNDTSDEPDRLTVFDENLRAILGRIASETEADTILLTPSFMASRESDAVAEEHRSFAPQLRSMQTGGHLARYAATIREIAASRGVPLADVHAAWEYLEGQGVDTTALLANGLNHPTGSAHVIAARCILRVIDPDAPCVEARAGD